MPAAFANASGEDATSHADISQISRLGPQMQARRVGSIAMISIHHFAEEPSEMCAYDSGESRDPLNRINRAALLAWKRFNGSRLSPGGRSFLLRGTPVCFE